MCLILFLKNTPWIHPLFGVYGGVFFILKHVDFPADKILSIPRLFSSISFRPGRWWIAADGGSCTSAEALGKSSRRHGRGARYMGNAVFRFPNVMLRYHEEGWTRDPKMNRERIWILLNQVFFLRCLCKYLEDAAYLGMSSQKQSGPVDEESVPDFQLTYGNFGAKQVSKKGMLGNLKTLLGKEILHCHKDIKKNRPIVCVPSCAPF